MTAALVSKIGTGLEVSGNGANNSIKSGKGADKLFGGAGKDTLYGGAGNDMLYGGSGNDKLYGEKGNDSIFGGIGNDTLTGGAGKDLFVYEGGKDYIADYKEGEDKIKILSGSVTKAKISDTNVVFTTSDGTITVKGAKGKNNSLLEADGKPSVYGGLSLKVTNKSKAAVTIGAAYRIADASTRTAAVKITGNEIDNTILGGSKADTLYGMAGNDKLDGGAGNDKLYGGDGNDTLIGGKGNDSLYGGSGNDMLYSGDGKDIIYGFDNTDMLQITGAFTTSYNKTKKEIYFKIDSTANALMLKDFGSTATFNINGDAYKISGSKLAIK